MGREDGQVPQDPACSLGPRVCCKSLRRAWPWGLRSLGARCVGGAFCVAGTAQPSRTRRMRAVGDEPERDAWGTCAQLAGGAGHGASCEGLARRVAAFCPAVPRGHLQPCVHSCPATVPSGVWAAPALCSVGSALEADRAHRSAFHLATPHEVALSLPSTHCDDDPEVNRLFSCFVFRFISTAMGP